MTKKKGSMSARGLLKVVRTVQKEKSGDFKVAMIGEENVGKRALASLITFESKGYSDRVAVLDVLGVVDPKTFSLVKQSDLALFVIDGSKEFPGWLKMIIADLKKLKMHYLIVINKGDIAKEGYEGLENKAIGDLAVKSGDVVAISLLKGERIRESLISAVVSKAHRFSLALGTSFPVFREAVADKIISSTSRQNGLVGFLVFLPGADFPVLTMNQAKMVLSLAVLYGEEINLNRAIEIIILFGGGFTFRAIARELFDLLPGIGWVIKGAVAYSGTVAIGRGAQKYFESGARVTPGSVVELAKRLVDQEFGSKLARADSSQG